MSDDKREIFNRAQTALLAIPGHAEYYRDRINEARRKVDVLPPDSVERGPLRGMLYNEQMNGFQTLSQLPSAETIRVLGEFLFDDRGTLPGDGEQAAVERPISRDAATALSKLPLVARPVTSKESGREDTPTWRLWYQQVKAGTRTFRFVGDPKEYNLRDIMQQQAAVDSTVRPPRHVTADRPPATIVADAAPASGSSGALPILIAAVLAILAALWYFLRVRHSRPA
jgi:hypothetical protein